MDIHFAADLRSVHNRLAGKHTRERRLENLRRMLNAEPPVPVSKHEYVKENKAGLGFCTVCFSDDLKDGNHTVSSS